MAKEILVVDDDIVTLRAVEEMLADGGYSVSVAVSGEEALDKIIAKKPDMVLLDIKMPGMDGIDTLKRIKEIDPGLAVVMLTAYGSMRSAVEAFRLGAFDYVDKPVTEKELLDKVKKAFEE